MIYTTLRKLPMITCIEILETGDISLLSDENTPIEELSEIWDTLYKQYKDKYGKDNKKILTLSSEIDFLERKYIVVKCAIEALKFDVYQELIDILLEYGYKLSKETYLDDLERIERECEGIVQKIKLFQSQLPKNTEKKEDMSSAIINIMAGYSAVLGYDFDFYNISVEKYYSIEKQAKNKIESIEKQNAKIKK